MVLRCIGTGSSGNSYALIDNNSKILLLDLGMSTMDIKKSINFRISDVIGAVVTHHHADHSKSEKDFENMGISVFAPYKCLEPMSFNGMCGLTIQAFDLTTLDGKWTHTNASDDSECSCYGFLITHPDIGRMLYITDTELIKWRFKNINHILIGCDYQNKYLSYDEEKRAHVMRGHLELETCKEFIKANNSDSLQNVILCHLSHENANGNEMVAEVQNVVGNSVLVDYAIAGKEWKLRDKNRCPF